MLAGQVTGPGRLEMVEVAPPECGEGQILVRLESGAICGSDLPYYHLDREHPALAGLHAPLPPGWSLHELAGYVEQSRCARFREGDRVLALPYGQQGLSELFLSAPELAVPLPPGPAEQLALAQPLGTVVHACLKLGNLLGARAVVVGQGPIGQLFTGLLRRMGVLEVLAVDLLPERLAVSRVMGAAHTLCAGGESGPPPHLACAGPEAVRRAVLELTGGRGPDLVVEAVGLEETFDLCATLVRHRGTLLAFGVPHRAHYRVAFRDFFVKDGRLINSLGPDIQHDFPIAVELISGGTLDVRPLVTHRFPFDRAPEAFRLFSDRADGAIKVVLNAGPPAGA